MLRPRNVKIDNLKTVDFELIGFLSLSGLRGNRMSDSGYTMGAMGSGQLVLDHKVVLDHL